MNRRQYESYCAKHMPRSDYELYGAKAMAKRGLELPQSKLDADKVRAIRENRDKLTARQWASLLGVHYRTIENVRQGVRWVHV